MTIHFLRVDPLPPIAVSSSVRVASVVLFGEGNIQFVCINKTMKTFRVIGLKANVHLPGYSSLENKWRRAGGGVL